MLANPKNLVKIHYPRLVQKTWHEWESSFPCSKYLTSISLHPNNELCIRYLPRIKRYKDNSDDRDNKFLANAVENNLSSPNQRCILDAKDVTKIVEKPLKRGWGLLPSEKKFTKKVSKKISRALNAIEKVFGKKNLRFLTLTLPGSTDAALREMSAYSAYITNRVSTWLGDIIGEFIGYKVAVWELQKRGALHLHVVIAHPDKQILKKVDQGFKKFCYRMFIQLSDISGVDMFARRVGGSWKGNSTILKSNSEEIRKSVANYMSKYLTKTEKNLGKNGKVYFSAYPSRWASFGRKVTGLILGETVNLKPKTIDSEDAEFLVKLCLKNSETWGAEGYKPLLYKDKVGGGINFKMFVSSDKIGELLNAIGYWFDYIYSEEPIPSLINFPSYEEAELYYVEEAYSRMKREENIQKYGNWDGRLWQKRFRNNSHPIPGFENAVRKSAYF